MLSSFADLAALSALVYSRPEVTEAGPLVIDGGRHPVMSSLQPLHFVENSAFVNSLQNFQVVTGPNGSGKSTFIKQTAIIVIMAQMGCYVPARHAVVPIRDQIFSRIGTGDDMENNLSSFQVEMKETAHVLRSLSDQSLVIVDELGRGTSNADGVAIALAVGEYLLSTAAYTFFVTHYSQVAALAAMYANVKNVHFLTTVDVGSSALGYLHKIAEGPCDMKSGYGLLVAESCGLSEEFIAMARDFQRRLRRTYPLALRTREGVVSAAARMHRATALVQRLVILKDSTLDDGGIRSYLAGLSKTLTAE
ncbi:MSH4, partial [Symbiodinium microadriaticum]